MATPHRLGISTAIGRGILPRALLDMVERAEKDVQAMIKAAPDNAAASARERQELYDRIKARYEQLSRELAAAVDKGARKASEEEAVRTARTMPRGAKPHLLTRDQMITALDGRSVDQLVATATQSMSGNAIRHLRNAAARAFGRAAIEGLDANGTHKLLQEEWDREAGDKAAFRFVDKRGAQWSNARYLQMLVRTTSAEVRRNTMTNTFVQNGRDLARISEDSDEAGLCEACARWEGRIVSLTGATEGFPTMEEAKADGLFHPNCTHRIEYLDEDEVEAALAERDARLGKQEPEDESGGGRPPEPPKKATGGGDEEERKQAEAEARQSIADLGNIGVRAQNITDKASADKAIADMKAVIERAEKQEAVAQGAVREALRKALEAARKKFDEVERKIVSFQLKSKFPKTIRDDAHKAVFDEAPTRAVKKIRDAVKEFRSTSTTRGYCFPDGRININRDMNSWAGNASTILHESGHAVLKKAGQPFVGGITRKFRPIFEAATREAEAFATSLLGKDWEAVSSTRAFKDAGYARFSAALGFDESKYFELPMRERHQIGAISDICNATTLGRCFRGHTPREIGGEGGALHEIVANATSLLFSPEAEKARSIFPDTLALVDELVYGGPKTQPRSS